MHISCGSIPAEDEVLVDASLNTLFVFCRSELTVPAHSAAFRAHFVARLARPPPGKRSSFIFTCKHNMDFAEARRSE